MRLIQKVYHFIVDPKIPTLSGSLCFFLLLNGGSYLFLFVSLSSYFFVDLFSFLEMHLEEGLFKDIILYLFEHNANLSFSLFLLGSSIYSSSSLYYHFIHICELITKQTSKYRFGKRVVSLILVPLVLVVLFLIISLLSFIQMLLGSIIYFLYIIFALIFIYFLNKLALKGYSFHRLIKGVLFSFFYQFIFTFLFLIYLNVFSNFKIVYGLLSFIIIFLFYLYNLIIAIFLGIYINCKNLAVSNLFFD